MQSMMPRSIFQQRDYCQTVLKCVLRFRNTCLQLAKSLGELQPGPCCGLQILQSSFGVAIHSSVVHMAFGRRATHSFHPAVQPCVRVGPEEWSTKVTACCQHCGGMEGGSKCRGAAALSCHGALGGLRCWWGAGRDCELSSAEFST